jgi:predicted metalloprotease with PDZ domain
MWIAHGKPGGPSPAIIAKPYTLKDARDRLAEVSGDRKFADDFFDKYIEGRELPNYERLFARVGLVLRKRNPGAPWAGLMDQSFGGGRRARRGASAAASTGAGFLVPALVNWGTPAFLAGIEEGDLITSADGRAVSTIEDWQAAVRAHKPGDSMPVEFTRHGTIVKATITLADDPTVEVVTAESTGASLTTDQKMMRDGWLGSKRKVGQGL